VFADLDGEQALDDTRYLVWLIKDCLEVIPKVWFSGGKGFHVIIPYEIVHPQAHLVVKDFVANISSVIKSLDQRVYRTKSLLRLSGWRGSVEGQYKIELTINELNSLTLEAIAELSSTRRLLNIPVDTQKLAECQAFLDHLNRSIDNLPTLKTDVTTYINDLGSDLMPCVEHLIKSMPVDGHRNQAACIVARVFKSCGLPEDMGLKTLLNQPHWQEFNLNGEVSRVFKSIYRSAQPPRVGCRGQTIDAIFLRKFCQPLCPFSADFGSVGFVR
jgi:hypothetical protein